MFLPLYYITVLASTLGGSFQFYSFDVVNPAQSILTQWINETYTARNGKGMDQAALNLYWSATVSIVAIGAIVGALFTRPLAERMGRRNGLIANGVLNVGGGLLQYFAKPLGSPEMLILGRFILGGNMGLASGLVPIYLQEISPTSKRGKVSTFHQRAGVAARQFPTTRRRAYTSFKASVAFADWFSLLVALPEVLGNKEQWPLAFSFPAAPALLLVMILPFSPESPKYTLLVRGEKDAALRDLRRLVDEEEAQQMFQVLLEEASVMEDNLSSSASSYRELFTRKDLRGPLLISIYMMIAQQFTGCAAVFAFSTEIFMASGITPIISRFSTLGLGIAYFIFTLISAALIERLGRRILSIFQLGSLTVALALLSTFTWIQQSAGSSPLINYGTVLSLTLYMSVYGVGR